MIRFGKVFSSVLMLPVPLMLMLMLMLVFVGGSAVFALERQLPKAVLYVPPMVKEESISTYVPSDSAPGQGLAVNLMYSAKPRYKDGAPVMVLVPGGNGSQGLDFDMHAAQQGFIEVRFAFPGGGKPGFVSSGIYDNRGVKSQEALRDIFRFAAGEITDYQDKNISDLLPCRVSNKTVGAVGWSNGGNTLLVTLGKFGEQLPFVNWAAFYESPVGPMFYPPTLGGAQDMLTNKHYRQGTAATGQVLVDYRLLRYQNTSSKAPGAHKKVDEPELAGVAYFDENRNGVWDETSEFSLPYSTDIGYDKQIYPPSVTKALLTLDEFHPIKQENKDKKAKGGEPLPDIPRFTPFAKYPESLAYFRERDGSLYIKEVIEQHPEMAFTVFGSHLDHLQRQPDHPHIAMLYNSLLAAKPKFLRLNPSSVYVGAVSFMKSATFAENRPNMSIDSDTIDQYLEPEGLLPAYSYMEAAACELSDRERTNKWVKALEAPLITYSNGAEPPPDPNAKPKPAKKPVTTTDSPIMFGSSRAKSGNKGSGSNSGSGTGASGSYPKVVPGPPESSTPKDWPFKK